MSETTTARLQAIQEQFRSKSGSGRLDGAVAIVTGVGSLTGIGRASALGFAREGAKALYLLDFDGSNLDDLRTAVLKLAPQCKVVTLEGDAADEETIKGLCQRALDEHGALDVCASVRCDGGAERAQSSPTPASRAAIASRTPIWTNINGCVFGERDVASVKTAGRLADRSHRF